MRSNCILLRGDPIYGEGAATTTIIPGMLLSVAGAFQTVGGAASVTPAAAGAVSTTFARENEVMGYGTDDNYVEDDNVLYMTNRAGDVVQGWLAAGQNIVAGAPLACVGGGLLGAPSAGDGAASPVTFPTAPVARAAETINNSGGGAVPVRINVEVL